MPFGLNVNAMGCDELSQLAEIHTLGTRLRLVRGQMTREQAGELLGVHPNTLQKYEGDKRVPDADFIVKFCTAFHVQESWLLRGKGANPPLLIAEGEAEAALLSELGAGLLPVPFYEVRAGAGSQQIASDEKPTKQIYLPQDLFLMRGIKPHSAKLMLSSGTSMEPTISDGDLIMLDASETSHNDGIYVIGRDGGVLVKRLQWRSDGSLTMISDNKAYEQERLPRDDADDLRIIGRVRMVFKSV